MLRNSFLAALIAAVVINHSLFAQGARTWKDATGKFSIEAEFVEANETEVVLDSATRGRITIAIKKLSQADQEYVKQRQKPAKPKAAADSGNKPTSAAVPADLAVPAKPADAIVGKIDEFFIRAIEAAKSAHCTMALNIQDIDKVGALGLDRFDTIPKDRALFIGRTKAGIIEGRKLKLSLHSYQIGLRGSTKKKDTAQEFMGKPDSVEMGKVLEALVAEDIEWNIYGYLKLGFGTTGDAVGLLKALEIDCDKFLSQHP